MNVSFGSIPGNGTGDEPRPTSNSRPPLDLLETALAASDAGLSVHRPHENGSKAPDPIYPGVDEDGKPKWSWLHADGQPPSRATLREWYGPRQGIGLRCGAASGGLECYEFDCRETYETFLETAKECGLADLVNRIEAGYREVSPGGGIHLLYFCGEIRGNTKLAKRPSPTDDNPRGVKTLIETRGENGFIIIAPSGGTVHESGRPYVLTSGGLQTIETITAEERNALWDLGRSFDAMPRTDAEPKPTRQVVDDGARPGDAYGQEVSWDDLLTTEGWTVVNRQGEKTAWRRPGKSIGISATTNHGGSNLLYVFTTSTSFDSEKSYTKFGAYTVLHHGGNFSEAAKALRREGYGASQEAPVSKRSRQSGCDSTGASDVFPDGQNPDGLVENEWLPPRLSEVPCAEPFPVDVLPPPLAEYVRSIASSIGCPVDFAALSTLVVAGAAIGRSASLMLRPGEFVSTSLYGMNVGNATSGKTPSLNFALNPLVDINVEYLDHFRDDMVRCNEEEDAWNHAAKTSKPPARKPPRPVRPSLRTVLLNDSTTEIVKTRLAENPRGLLNAYDEGSAWIGSLNQYKSGKGTDRQFYLSVLNGTSIRVDRMKDKDQPTSIPHPFLSVIGNMTPDTLGELREGEGRSDGFVEQILFAFPEARARPPWNDDGLNPELVDRWKKIIHRLRERPMVLREGREAPNVVYFTTEARRVWADFYDANSLEAMTPGYEASELSVDGKLENFTARLAFILHLLSLVCDPTTDPVGSIPPLPAEALDHAIALWRYFRANHRRVRWQMNGGIENKDARAIMDWIKRHDRSSFTRKELTDHLRWLAERAGGPDGVLGWMEDRHILRRRPSPPREHGRRGQPPSPVFEVNPAIVASQNSRNSIPDDQEPISDDQDGNSANSANEGVTNEDLATKVEDKGVTWTV